VDLEGLRTLTAGLSGITWGAAVMMLIGVLLIWLAVSRQYEPLLLLPIGLGCILANIPHTGMLDEGGLLRVLYDAGIANNLLPSLIFLGVGPMTDFGPLMQNPKYILFGAAAEFGCFSALLFATAVGFSINQASTIGTIGSADGPTTIMGATRMAPAFLGTVSVAAYSYIALVPVIQPPAIRLLTTPKERAVRMPHLNCQVPRSQRIAFPIVATQICGIIAPESLPLVGMLMFGNLAREAGVVERISRTAHDEVSSIVTTFLGITIGSTMDAARFLKLETLLILGLGLAAFVMGTASGVMLGKLMDRISGGKINPLLGSCGISAFPMSARVAQRIAREAD